MRARVPKAPEGKDGYIVQMSIYHFHNPTIGMRDQEGNLVQFDEKDIGPAYVRRTLFHNLRHNVVNLPASLSRQSFSTNKPVEMETVTMQEFGFSHPVLLDFDRAVKRTIIDPDALRQAVEDAIIKERTTKIKALGTTKKAPTTTGAGAMGGPGGGLGGLTANAADTSLTGGYSFSGSQNPLLALAGSNPGNIQQGTTGVVNMIKLLRDDQKLDANKFEAVVQFVWIPKTPTEREEAKKAAQEKLLAELAAATQGTDEQQLPDDETNVGDANGTAVDPGMQTGVTNADDAAGTANDTAVTEQPDSPTDIPVTPQDDTTPDDTTSP